MLIKVVKPNRKARKAAVSSKLPMPTPVPAESGRIFPVEEFCDRNLICRENLYRQWRLGIGPRRTRLSPRRVGITEEAEREWRAARQEMPGVAATNEDCSK